MESLNEVSMAEHIAVVRPRVYRALNNGRPNMELGGITMGQEIGCH
jgi:hypothetical protein